MQRLTVEDIKEIKKIRKNLFKIKEKGTAPINLVKYKKWGLVKSRTYMDKKGKNIKDVKLSLTKKGQMILNANL